MNAEHMTCGKRRTDARDERNDMRGHRTGYTVRSTRVGPSRVTAALVAATLLLIQPPAFADDRPPAFAGRTEVLVLDGKSLRGGGSLKIQMSDDARFVGFSHGHPFLPEDRNSKDDVFVLDRTLNRIERVSVNSQGEEANGHSAMGGISGDGRIVAFVSEATNLVPGDTNADADIFVHDRSTHKTTRVSLATDGTQGTVGSRYPAISADGRHVAFVSWAENLVPGDTNQERDVFVHDLDTGLTERVSVSSDEEQTQTPWGQSNNGGPVISNDGQIVGFTSRADNLVPNDTNGNKLGEDAFVRDRAAGTTEQVNLESDGTPMRSGALSALSGNGRFVVFGGETSAGLPAHPDANGYQATSFVRTGEYWGVWVRDLQTGRTERVGVDSFGRFLAAGGYSISDDGRFVLLEGWRSPSSTRLELTSPEFKSPGIEIYRRDMWTGATEHISVGTDGSYCIDDLGGKCGSAYPIMTRDGRHIAFESAAANWDPRHIPFQSDLFIRDLGPPGGLMEVSGEESSGAIEGWGRLHGTTVLGMDDVRGDVIHPLLGDYTRGQGLDLGSLSAVFRPESDDLLFRIGVDEIPFGKNPWATPFLWQFEPDDSGGIPGITYVITFTVGDERYRAIATANAPEEGNGFPGGTWLGLFRFDQDPTLGNADVTAWKYEQDLSGTIGGTGHEVLISIPVAAMGLQPGTSISDALIETRLGRTDKGYGYGSMGPALDALSLPGFTIPSYGVKVGVAPRGAALDGVTFDRTVQLTDDGRFQMDLGEGGEGPETAWLRSCVGTQCSYSTLDIER